jgi:hypothetical protein
VKSSTEPEEPREEGPMNPAGFTSDGEAAAESAAHELMIDEELDGIAADSQLRRGGTGLESPERMTGPAEPTRGGEVRGEILRQHGTLRGLLRRAVAQTTVDLRQRGTDSAGLGLLLSEVALRFREHLEFEEQTLVRALRVADAWGPQRVDRLLDEHDRQRREIDALSRGLAEGWDTQQIALALRSLVTDFLVDMAEEEAGALAALRDEVFVAEQMTG